MNERSKPVIEISPITIPILIAIWKKINATMPAANSEPNLSLLSKLIWSPRKGIDNKKNNKGKDN